jgi:hypothetical protein
MFLSVSPLICDSSSSITVIELCSRVVLMEFSIGWLIAATDLESVLFEPLDFNKYTARFAALVC